MEVEISLIYLYEDLKCHRNGSGPSASLLVGTFVQEARDI